MLLKASRHSGIVVINHSHITASSGPSWFHWNKSLVCAVWIGPLWFCFEWVPTVIDAIMHHSLLLAFSHLQGLPCFHRSALTEFKHLQSFNAHKSFFKYLHLLIYKEKCQYLLSIFAISLAAGRPTQTSYLWGISSRIKILKYNSNHYFYIICS